MKHALLAYLCCPVCHHDLALQVDRQDGTEILDGQLVCAECGHAYPIREGIPRLRTGEVPAIVQRNVEGFAYEWLRLEEPSPKYDAEFASYLGRWSARELFEGKIVLEAGCGMGKFLGCVQRAGAATVIGVDLGESVHAAYRLTRHLPNVHVVQADLHAMPFREPFDVAYSIGVIHHLPSPAEGLRAVARHLNAAGQLFVWVYGKEGNEFFMRWIDPLRQLTCRLPRPVTELLAKLIAAVLWGGIVGVYRPLARLGVRRLPLQEYFLYFHSLGFRFFWGTVLDKMVPDIQWFISREELSGWLQALGLEVQEVSQRNGHSWRALSRKPASASLEMVAG